LKSVSTAGPLADSPPTIQQQEQAAALLVRMAADALYLLDARGHVTFLNPAAERMFGWSLEALRGTTLHDAIHHQHPDGTAFPMSECPLGGVLLSGRTLTNHEDRFLHRDGHFVPVYCSNAPILENGRIVGAALVVHDLTATRRSEEEQRKRAELEQHLIGIVSHDLRNPLSAILTSAALLLRRGSLDERQAQGLSRILSSGERASRMIRDLLDFTQARLGGGIPLERGPTDLHVLARQVVDEAQLSHPERVLLLHTEGGGMGAWDADRLAQVLSNLLNNALQYSPPDSPVEVETRGEPDALVLQVHNQGAPIPPEELPTLFEPMRRAQQPGRPPRRGLGLGLYIVHHLVAAHGGSLQVESTPEQGTTFTVRLPRR
jgi:PAS domain S-box-containing protein